MYQQQFNPSQQQQQIQQPGMGQQHPSMIPPPNMTANNGPNPNMTPMGPSNPYAKPSLASLARPPSTTIYQQGYR